jgi:hypothetical protein
MAAKDCIDAVKEALGEDNTEKQLNDIFELLDRRSKAQLRDNPTMTNEQAIVAAAQSLASEKKLAALIERRNEAINRMRNSSREDFYKGLEAKNVKRSDAIRALTVGREGPWQDAGRSVDAVKHALEGPELLGPMVAELERANLLEAAVMKDPDFERNVAREMAIANGAKNVQPTGDSNAQALAAIFTKYTETARTLQNKAGAYIRKMEGYVARQSHDQLKIAKAGFDVWKAKITPLLDVRTFDDALDVDKFLTAVYANLASGNHMRATGASDWMGGFKGSGNLAKRISQERVLMFKGPDEWLAYNNEFGRASLYESVLDSLGFAARNTALMRTFGTNPEAAFRADIDRAIESAKKTADIKEVNALGSSMLEAEFNQISGGVLQHGNPNAAAINGGIRSVISMAKLGGVVLSSLPDIAVRASVLRHNGVNLFEGYKNSLDSLFGNFRGSGKREVGDLLNAGTQGILGGVYERFHATDSVPGTLTRLSNIFFKATGLTWWTDAMSRGMGVMLSRNMAIQVGNKVPYANLDPLLRTTLGRYGISERAWGALQEAKLHEADGQTFLTPDAVDGLSDAAIRSYLDKADASTRAVDEGRDNLKTSLSAYYTDQVRESMTFAGAKEQALTTFGSSSGTPLGEAVRYIMQFKQFPVTYIVKHLGRELNRGDTVNAGGLANLIVGTTALGYVAMTAKEYAKGRNPREPEDAAGWAKLAMAAMQQGGGVGIYGDFLFGNANRFGGGVIGTLAGPAAGLLEQYVGVLQAARDGDDPRAKAVRAAVGSTPFANIFYARLALDHLILNSTMEALNPGYLRRYERQVEKDNSQTFWLPPSEAAR